MAGRGGGPSRRSHTKSRKGCKTCKRRHIRCDETFPQCRNCTKHHVRCDYLEGPAGGDEDLQISTSTGLSWTPEIEKVVDTWQSTGRLPFANLELSPFPNVKTLSKNEIRLLYHVCAILNELKQSRTAKLSVWTDIMPKCIAVAADQNLALQAVFAFASSHMAWESQSTIARTIASEYICATVKELREAMSGFSRANADGVLAASLILSWLHNDWRMWAHEMSGLKTVIQVSQQFRPDTPFEEYLALNPIDPLQAFTSTSTYPMTEQRQQDNMKTFQSIRTALQRLQMSITQSPDDVKLVERMDLLIQSFVNAPVAETPKDQFERLYNMRKMLFWLPVNLLSMRRGDIHSLLVLSHYYATSLALENVFSDIGAPFLSILVAPPLLEIINIIQTCQAAQIQDPLAQTAAGLMDFPREALAQYHSRREWALQQANMQAHASQQMVNESQNFDLINQFGGMDMPPPSLSPAFASTTIHLTPPPNSARLSRPPFLEVPGNITEQFAYQSYTPTTPGFHTPTSAYLSSPMLSPAFPLDGDSTSYHLPVPGYESRRISAELGDLNVASMEEYTNMTPSSGVYQSNIGSIAGGCVGPTAVWT